MPDRIPIQDAKEIAVRRGCRQVILLAWDGERTHVVTYGKSIEDCDQAAQGGEAMKKVMGWPNWESRPRRVEKLRGLVQRLVDHLRFGHPAFHCPVCSCSDKSPKVRAKIFDGINHTTDCVLADADKVLRD